jgi:hypothetical protein
MSLHLHSERFGPVGNIDARAARRAIGRPALDPWSVFLRETLQNSWDVRLRDDGPITFSVDAWWAGAKQLGALRGRVFATEPPELAVHEVLSSDDVGLLLVSDTGTRGLAGPTRADIAAGEHTDFVDFVRNIGRDESKGYAGGTYGFGKAVLYDASVCSTVLVFSRTTTQGRPVSRFMAMALGSPYTSRRRRFTGRHWWGISDPITGAEPVTGRQAESLARALGMDTIPYETTGTSIMVLAPVAYEKESLQEIVERIAMAASWHAWPHMIDSPLGPSIHFRFTYEQEHVDIPGPSTDPILRRYADAYLLADGVLRGDVETGRRWPWDINEIRSERPRRRLGVLVHRSYQRAAPGPDSGPAPFGNGSSHVALMRKPRFVVRYLEVPADPQGLHRAGVFIADPELETEFALAEPVAHDDWVPENLELEKYQRNPVRQALDRIRAAFRPRLQGEPAVQGGGRFEGVARVASLLGLLVAGQPGGTDLSAGEDRDAGGSGIGGGRGANGGAGSAGGRSNPQRSSRTGAWLEMAERPRLLLSEGGDLLVEFDFDIRRSTPGSAVRVTAVPRVIVDGAHVEPPDDAPAGVDLPQVLGWRDRRRDRFLPGDQLLIDPQGELQWSVRLTQPPDTAVSVLLRVDVEPER